MNWKRLGIVMSIAFNIVLAIQFTYGLVLVNTFWKSLLIVGGAVFFWSWLVYDLIELRHELNSDYEEDVES